MAMCPPPQARARHSGPQGPCAVRPQQRQQQGGSRPWCLLNSSPPSLSMSRPSSAGATSCSTASSLAWWAWSSSSSASSPPQSTRARRWVCCLPPLPSPPLPSILPACTHMPHMLTHVPHMLTHVPHVLTHVPHVQGYASGVTFSGAGDVSRADSSNGTVNGGATLVTVTDPSLADLSAGNTSWMLVSTALVLLMTPGLGFFYVRAWLPRAYRTCNIACSLLMPTRTQTNKHITGTTIHAGPCTPTTHNRSHACARTHVDAHAHRACPACSSRLGWASSSCIHACVTSPAGRPANSQAHTPMGARTVAHAHMAAHAHQFTLGF